VKIDRLITIKEVENIVQISNSAIWVKVKDGTFPQPVRPTPKATRWRMSDVQDYIANLGNDAVA